MQVEAPANHQDRILSCYEAAAELGYTDDFGNLV